MYTNIDQFVNKREDLIMMIADNKPDLIMLTEVIPKAQVNPIPIAILTIPEYSLYLNFDPSISKLGRGGHRGIAIFVSNKLQATQVSFPQCSFQEQLWVKIPLQSPDILLVGCFYRSPSSSGQSSTINLIDLLRTCSAENFSHIVVAGDLNMPQIDWTSDFSYAPEGHYSHISIEGMQECGFTQHVTKATRYRQGERPSTLDIILSNEPGLVQSLTTHPPIGNSDHIVLQFQLVCHAQETVTSGVHLNLNKGDYQLLNKLVRETSWDTVMPPDPQYHYELFKRTFGHIVSRCIPRACPKGKRRSIFITREALRLKARKKKLWRAYTNSRNEINYARYTRCRNDLRRLTRNLRRGFEQNLVLNIKDNPKGFWRYASSRMKSRGGIENLRTEGGALTTSDEEKAAVLNKFFSSVCTLEDPHDIPEPVIAYAGPTVDDVEITEDTVRGKLSQLRPNSAAGPDGIHPRILREAADSVSPILADMFRESLDTGLVPQDWTLADVVPIYKKGDKDDPGNYRPVSLTSVPCKVLESIIRDQLMTHLQSRNLLTDAQHGFRPGRSCATQLMLTIEEWSSMIERGEPVDVLYLDLAKAFNTVPIRRLLRKLKAHGIEGKLLQWIQAFLVGRQQRVIVGGSRSGWTPVPSGVPQGSVLAPLLFTLYVNDLPDSLHCGVKIFADDSKLYRTVRLPVDSLALQDDLNAAANWADDWQLRFNADKCKVMHIGTANRQHKYCMNGSPLEAVGMEKDLGIYMDTDLKFKRQAAAAVSKASQVLAIICKSFQLLDRSTLPMLFKTLVRPHLEYGNIVWGPFNRADQKLVERVQRRATKKVPDLRHLPYQHRLKALKLPSLYYRRRRGDMIAVYQVLHGGLDIDPLNFFDRTHARDTRGHPWRLAKPRANTRVRRNAFAVRVVNDWNSLPAAVVNSETVNQFKNRLDAHWAHLTHAIPQTDD